MPPTIFGRDQLDKAVSDVEARPGRGLDLDVSGAPGDRLTLAVEAQGEHDGAQVDATWAAYVRTQFSKATTAVGARLGVRW